MDIAILGGGAAGFFAAISCKSHHPTAHVTIYEKTNKLLAKVKVSGGGRCNVTNACHELPALAKHYPRGGNPLKKALGVFGVGDTMAWFGQRGVRLKTEADNRVFPVTDSSQTIIDCLLGEARRLGVAIRQRAPVTVLGKDGGKFHLQAPTVGKFTADRLVVATGGAPKMGGFAFMAPLGHTIVPPVPSLFTFNMPDEPITSLMGLACPSVSAHIQGTKLMQQGPLLVTHWGMSGPAILKLSAWGARELHAMGYTCQVRVNWLGQPQEEPTRQVALATRESAPKRKIANKNPYGLPQRLWAHLLEKTGIPPEARWADIGKKNTNKLLDTLRNDTYQVSGKTTFKEEFVTCGGVSLQEVAFDTMESRHCQGLFFAGEVLDVDGVTGGFNFQAAWSTGYVAGKLGLP